LYRPVLHYIQLYSLQAYGIILGLHHNGEL